MTPARYQAAARTLLRDTLLDAAGELMDEAPWSEISMAAIAAQAGVSRQTLYNEFGSRDDFAQAYVLREADRFLNTVESAFAEHADNPTEALRVGFRVFLEETENNPMVRNIIIREPGADELFSLFTTRGGPVVELATARLAEKISELWPEADTRQVRMFASALVRLGISHAGLPEGTPAQAADDVAEMLEPFMYAALGL
jgi:AcrR family transcriptional regulator